MCVFFFMYSVQQQLGILLLHFSFTLCVFIMAPSKKKGSSEQNPSKGKAVLSKNIRPSTRQHKPKTSSPKKHEGSQKITGTRLTELLSKAMEDITRKAQQAKEEHRESSSNDEDQVSLDDSMEDATYIPEKDVDTNMDSEEENQSDKGGAYIKDVPSEQDESEEESKNASGE